MKTLFLIIGFLFLIEFEVLSQLPFEKFPTLKFTKISGWKKYDLLEKEGKIHWTLTVPKYFDLTDSLTIQLTTYKNSDTSLIRIYMNEKQIQILKEPFPIGKPFGDLLDTIYCADINGDSLLDVKLICWYGGCGIAGLNCRVIYLFQKPNYRFTKVSYLDMDPQSHIERNFDGDRNFEILTMTLDNYQSHSYWTYNLYNFVEDSLQPVNNKFDYPIMVQFLHRQNFEITNKITREKMKSFEKKLPEYFDMKK